jgi:hypothetical protein
LVAAASGLPTSARSTFSLHRRWLLKEGSEFPIRFVEGRVKCPKCGSQKVKPLLGSVFAKTSKKS